VLAQMRSLAPVLTARGMVVVEKVRPGQHTFSVWRAALRESLDWAVSGLTPPTVTARFGRSGE
jgi:hypothetical protein